VTSRGCAYPGGCQDADNSHLNWQPVACFFPTAYSIVAIANCTRVAEILNRLLSQYFALLYFLLLMTMIPHILKRSSVPGPVLQHAPHSLQCALLTVRKVPALRTAEPGLPLCGRGFISSEQMAYSDAMIPARSTRPFITLKCAIQSIAQVRSQPQNDGFVFFSALYLV
jgi:hypothetical protein